MTKSAITSENHNHSLEGDVQEALRFFRKQGMSPFTGTDTSVGMEHELQVAVEGDYKDVDLPIIISNSRYYKNTIKRASRGDLPTSAVDELVTYLEQNKENIWENSWVYFSEQRLMTPTRHILSRDMLADKSNPNSARRSDVKTFYCIRKGSENLRVPISYVLKLALLDAIYRGKNPLPLVRAAEKLTENFTSDNTSPEILSFNLVKGKGKQSGIEAAKEGARVFLTTQLLSQYANRQFGLIENGQKCLVYNGPHAPRRQKILNELVPEGFYRHLFMSPCLSGWNKGEEKHRYMALCHRTLSGSQLNTISKLKDAGIIKNNLTILPNTSNTCLANNGTHISIGSMSLSQLAANQTSVFTEGAEKYLGDLAIKVIEHFLPLFVNTYTAAPYRVDFSDCHPENILGFLPHELDYTHLRMIWRRWKKKADLTFMGKNFTPFGPRKLDRILAKTLSLKGDFIPDYRLIDYLVTLRSTETSPALNGHMGNQTQLKEELSEMGIFDRNMSIYLPYRMRNYSRMGYSGFEGRSYSLFQSFMGDMAEAVSMQNLITAFAYKCIIEGRIHHPDIPDTPSVESERRQVFFGNALGIPTFYVRANSGNRFLKKILSKVQRQRNSRRYKGYIRIETSAYQQALISVLTNDGGELVKELGMEECIASLRRRLSGDGHSSLEKVVTECCEVSGFSSPMNVSADIFNQATERYYRTELKKKQLIEGLDVLLEDCERLEKENNSQLREVTSLLDIDCSCCDFINSNREDLLSENCDTLILQTFIAITTAVVCEQQSDAA